MPFCAGAVSIASVALHRVPPLYGPCCQQAAEVEQAPKPCLRERGKNCLLNICLEV